MIKFIIIFFFFIQNFLFSQTIFLNQDVYELDKFQISYFKDINSSLDYNEIKKIDFTEKVSNRFTFGYIDYPIWFKLNLHNDSNKENTFILALEEPFFDSIKLIYEKNNEIHEINNSINDNILDRQQPNPNSHFKILLEPNETLTVYLKVRSLFSTFAEILIYNDKYYNFSSKKFYFIYFIYFGAIVTMALYNLFLFLYLKEVSYFYYFGYSLNFGFWMGLFSGILYYYIPIKYIYHLHFCAPLALVFLILFSNRILNIKSSYPIMYKILNLNLVFLLILVFWIPFDIAIGFTLLNIISTYLFFTYFILSFILILKKSTIAKYYFIAIGIFLITISLLSLMTIGILPNNVYFRYLFVAGSFIELVMLSLILAFKINLIQKEYQYKLEEEILKQTKNINEQNETLKNLLKEKEEHLKEIFHRIKNNFQILIAMLSLEINKEDSNYTKNKLENIIIKLKSMSIVYDMLYNQNNNETINVKEFFTKLCFHLSLPSIHIKSLIDDIYLNSKITKDLGLLVNELITNSIKHSNHKEICEIYLNISQKENIIILEYKDNGENIKKTTNKEGYGTFFIEEFSSKFNNCTINLDKNDSFHYHINFEVTN
ncbi:MAG: 7TM diverse intracellular signaling domain-containing protein [Aliarcobacter sp.]|nr:7TM diverse intracellular signaling domain-containing protein [Aliarcobacter sp.]